jgi:hypothetical protein
MGHIWVPHKNWQAVVKDPNVGGSRTKANLPTKNKLQVKADVPELLIKMGYGKLGSLQAQAVGDLSLITFYYLLRIGKYTGK